MFKTLNILSDVSLNVNGFINVYDSISIILLHNIFDNFIIIFYTIFE